MLQNIGQSPDSQQDVSGLLLGLAVGASIYFCRERKLSTGAAGLHWPRAALLLCVKRKKGCMHMARHALQG